MNKQVKQFEAAKREYLSRKYPGDLAELVDQEVVQTPPNQTRVFASWNQWLVAAIFLVATSIGTLLLFDGSGQRRTGDSSEAGKPRANRKTPIAAPGLFTIKRPIQLARNSPKTSGQKQSLVAYLPSMKNSKPPSAAKFGKNPTENKISKNKPRMSIWSVASQTKSTRPDANKGNTAPQLSKAVLKTNKKKSDAKKKTRRTPVFLDRIQSNRRFTIRRF